MKKNILFFLTFFFIISFRVSAQPCSPVLVSPPEDAFVTIIPVTLDWEDVEGADCYLIEVTTDTTSSNKMSDTCNGYSSVTLYPLQKLNLTQHITGELHLMMVQALGHFHPIQNLQLPLKLL
jgi:hypothetical protein